MSIQVATDGPAELVMADFPRTQALEPPPLPMALIRRRSPRVVYAALYLAARGKPPHGRIRTLDADAPAERVSVAVEGPWGQAEHEVRA